MPSGRQILIALFVSTATICPYAHAEDAERLFSVKVLSTLKTKCFACHGGGPKSEIKGKLDVTSREGLLKGGESGEASISPGNPDDSPLLHAIRWNGIEMPPKENDRLTADQITDIQNWIKLGAPWPDAQTITKYQHEAWGEKVTADGELVTTSGGLSDDWTYRRYKPEDLWALRPVAKPNVDFGITHPVDYFISRKLTTAGFELAQRADPHVLVRRAFFDLTGLPPKPHELESFLQAWKINPDDAWSALIDQLLASPHYGERWAQHWLDVVRYADTGGYSNDYERSNAWRYRDYVVRSFNRDKPYNEFIIEQVAGDELADISVAKRGGGEKSVSDARHVGHYNPQEAEWIVATGFLRMGPFDSAMVKVPAARQIFVDDVINSVGQTFLSTTLRCVKCHDHKFDPIPTRDYYRLYATFAATQLAERAAPLLNSENKSDFAANRHHVEKMLAFATERKKAIEDKQENAARMWFAERNLEYKNEQDRRSLPDEQKPPRHYGLNTTEQGQLKVYKQDEWIWRRRLERFQPMTQSVFNADDSQIRFLNTRSLRILKTINLHTNTDTTILSGGSLEAKGETVTPGVLSGVGLSTGGDSYLLPTSLSGRRLGLARWIADPNNPLTTRSIVNRIWQYHFGKGIAPNSTNFGATGAKPTHPDLLNWLAADFVENGWQLKRLHKLLMTSRTYMQAAHRSDFTALSDSDPDNLLYGRFSPRRLSAEEIRDAMLAATGELNPTLGGLPVNPQINMEVALQPRMIQFSIAPAYQPSQSPQQRNRRSIYAYKVRGQADPFLEIFNQPNPNQSCEVRDQMAVTPQAFTLLNSDVVTARSVAMAKRIQGDTSSSADQIRSAFALVLGRAPTSSEIRRMRSYIKDMHVYHETHEPQPISYPTSIRRSLVEELSGDVFEYEERLPAFENYDADLMPADVDPLTRALADFCLLLFNTNEFSYIY